MKFLSRAESRVDMYLILFLCFSLGFGLMHKYYVTPEVKEARAEHERVMKAFERYKVELMRLEIENR